MALEIAVVPYLLKLIKWVLTDVYFFTNLWIMNDQIN